MKRGYVRGVAVAAALCLAMPCAARAQAVPPSVDPGQVINRWPQEGDVFQAPILVLPEDDSAAPLQDIAGETFVLKEVVLDQATVLAPAEVRDAAAPFIGQETDFARLEALAAKLTALYRRKGYILSSVLLEPQEIGDDGIVHFRAVEGRLAAVTFEGSVSPSPRMERLAQSIRSAGPARAGDIERGLLLMNDLPGVGVRAVFRPSPMQAEASDLVILLEKEKNSYGIALDNRGSRYLGPWQASGTAEWKNLFGQDSATTARVLGSLPADELKYADLTHERFLGAGGLKLSLHAAASRTSPGGNVSGLDIQGDSRTLEGRLSMPVLRSRPMNLTVYSGVALLNTESMLLGVANGKDRVRVLELGAEFDVTDRLSGKTEGGGGLRRGMGFLGATKNGAGRSRQNGEHDFTSFYGMISRTQYLPRGFSAVLTAKGQYALDALLASEEFAVGGADFGRAYDAAEITGDHGLAGSLEMRYAPALTLPWVDDWQLYGFYDAGVVWNRDRVALDAARESAASTGGGVRLGLTAGTEAQLEAATPLTRTVAAGEEKSDTRFFVKLAHRFSK